MNTSIDAQNTKKVLKEFEKGDKLLSKLGPAVTIYGSARTKRDTAEYQKTVELSEKLAKIGFSIISGGGPGAMQAANEGAFKVPEVDSVALGIKLPFETTLNQYHTIGYTFEYFFVRKVMMVKYAKAFICMEGGIGTLEELFETLTLIQTTKTPHSKVYLVGVSYWQGLLDWMSNSMLVEGYINKTDLDNIILTDDIDMIVKELEQKI